MSGLAAMARSMGAIITGEDQESTELTQSLIASGIPVVIDRVGAIPSDCDGVIVSAAVPETHAARISAAKRGIPVLTYAQFLGQLQSTRTGVSIAGTHGKSSTTALLGYILIEAGLDPSVIIGATCTQIGGGSRTGSSNIPHGPLAGRPGILVAEACEYTNSYHSHTPVIGLINNIEADHLDWFAGIDTIIESFHQFAMRLPTVPHGGRLLIAHDGAFKERIVEGLQCSARTFGTDPRADYRVEFDHTTRRARVVEGFQPILEWTPPLPGMHNRLNGAAAGVLALWLGADRASIERGLSTFAGVDRRSQWLGEYATKDGGKAIVLDDYGHHPTECRVTLDAIREKYQPKRLVCVFQPHQHSRTRFLLEDFARSFMAADRVILPDIYFVRDSEEERAAVSARDMVDRIRALGGSAVYAAPFNAVVRTLQHELQDGDLIVTMGAGPVFKIANALLANDPEAAMR